MAGPCSCHNIGKASINDDNTPVPAPAISCAPTFMPTQILVPIKITTPTQAFVLTPTFASALSRLGRYIDEDLQKVIKLAPESFVKSQEYGQLQANFAY